MGEDEEMKTSERYKRIRLEYMDALVEGITNNDDNKENDNVDEK